MARSPSVLDGSPMEEMTGAVRLGLFAGEAALALDRTIETRHVADDDRLVLDRGLRLLEDLGRLPGAEGGQNQLATGEVGLDVLTAIESEADDVELDQFLAPLAEGLKKALAGEVDAHIEQLRTLLRVFVAVGDAEVERVSHLSQPNSPSIPLWSPPQVTFHS
jgi:hypothetical protein